MNNDKLYCYDCNCCRIICDNINYVCTQCGDCVIDCMFVPSIQDYQHCRLTKKTIYKRIQYFELLLNRLLMHNFVNIDSETLNQIKINMNDDMSIVKLKSVLKQMNLTKYYKYLPYIYNKLYGPQCKSLTINEQMQLRNLFNELQSKFEINKNPNRMNFPNYQFIMYKLLMQIARDDLTIFIPLPKNKFLLRKHEKLYNQLFCKELNC